MVEGMARGVKYSMFIANGIIFIGGLVVFAIGVWTLADRSFMERLLGSNLYVASASLLIVSGVIVAIISFMGSIGAYKEIRCMLLTFFVILFFIFVLLLIGGILGYVFRNQVDDRMQNEMMSTIGLYGSDSSVTNAWDSVQRNFKCCGIAEGQRKSGEIWRSNPKFNEGIRVPESCCKFPRDPSSKTRCQQDALDATATWQDGCYEKMKDFVKGHALLIGGIGIGIACLLIIGMVLSCALFLMIN